MQKIYHSLLFLSLSVLAVAQQRLPEIAQSQEIITTETTNNGQRVAFDSTWTFIGPFNDQYDRPFSGGRVLMAEGYASDTNTILALTYGNVGLWRSNDAGKNWARITTNFTNSSGSLNVGYYFYNSFAYFPSDINDKIWLSTNTKSKKKPDDPKTIIDNYGGISISKDGGLTFKTVVAVNTQSTYSSYKTKFDDILFNPSNTNLVYATSEAGAFWMSVDGGNTFSEKTSLNALTYSDGGNTFFTNYSSLYSYLALSSSKPSTLYVMCWYYKDNKKDVRIFRSEDGGQNFSLMSTIPEKDFLIPQTVGFAVSPSNPNELWIGGRVLMRSLDGGKTFIKMNAKALDEQTTLNVEYLSFIGKRLYVATNQGLGRYENGDLVDISMNMSASNFIQFDVSNDGKRFAGVTNDKKRLYYFDEKKWTLIAAGKYISNVVIDKTNPNIIYSFKATEPNGYYFVKYDVSKNTEEILSSFYEGFEREKTLEQDTKDPNTFYLLGGVVSLNPEGIPNVSRNGGKNWEPLTTTYVPFFDPKKHTIGFNIYSPQNKFVMYACFQNFLTRVYYIYKTVDNGKIWNKIDEFELNKNILGSSITAISINDQTLYVFISGYSNQVEFNVKYTTDGGLTWKPSPLTFYSGRILKAGPKGDSELYFTDGYNILYGNIGTNKFRKISGGTFPNYLNVKQFVINPCEKKIYASVEGRGLWSQTLQDVPTNEELFKLNTASNEQTASICGVPLGETSRGPWNYTNFQWLKDGSSVANATNNQFVAKENGNYSLSYSYGNCKMESNKIAVSGLPQIVAPQPPQIEGFCKDQSVKLEIKSVYPFTATWSKDGKEITGISSGQLAVSEAGNYSAVVKSNSCSLNVPSVPVLFYTLEKPVISIDGNQIKAVGTPKGVLQWLLNGQPITNATASTYTATESGKYSLRVTHPCGTMSSDEVSYIILSTQTNFVEARVFPNPTVALLKVEIPTQEEVEVFLINALGSTIRSWKKVRYSLEVDMSSLPVGDYLLSIKNSQTSISKKISKL